MIDFIGEFLGPLGTVVVIAVIVLVSGLKILREYERAVIFRLGRMVAPRGPRDNLRHPVCRKNGARRSAHGNYGCPAAGRHHSG